MSEDDHLKRILELIHDDIEDIKKVLKIQIRKDELMKTQIDLLRMNVNDLYGKVERMGGVEH